MKGIALFVLAAWAGLASAPPRPSAASPHADGRSVPCGDTTVMLGFAVAQLRTDPLLYEPERLLYDGPPGMRMRRFDVLRLPLSSAFCAVQLTVGVNYGTYTFLAYRGMLAPIGGFTTPDVMRASEWLAAEVSDLRVRCEVLAVLARPSDHRHTFALRSADAEDREIVARWAQEPGPRGQRDTVVTHGDSTYIRTTVLSYDGFGYVEGWFPTNAVCVFNAQGTLIGWRQRGYRPSDPD